MTDHYVLANIKIPMIRKPNGKVESLIEYISIDFEKINELPAKPDYTANYNLIKQKLDQMLRSEPTTENIRPPCSETSDHSSAPLRSSLDCEENHGENKVEESPPFHSEISEDDVEERYSSSYLSHQSPFDTTMTNELSQMQKGKHGKQTSFKNRYVKNFRYTSKNYM